MNFIKTNLYGILAVLVPAVPAYFLGKQYPIIGGAVFAIILGMIAAMIWRRDPKDQRFAPGIKFVSKNILQWAVILLGFGLNLSVVAQTGLQSLPIIISTIATSLITAWAVGKMLGLGRDTTILVGVGSSICGGSAIAATAPVIKADDADVAKAISVVFFYNVLAALIFPCMGEWLGMDPASGEAFGIFAGTAVNDTSSVTAAAATWDSMNNLGSATLDKAVTVKLTRTLAIVPIVMVLSFMMGRKENGGGSKFSLKKTFPLFILFFILASVATTVCTSCFGVSADAFAPIKELSKIFIILAMAGIGLNTDLIKLIKTGGGALALGAACWIGITAVCLAMQKMLGLF